MNDLIVNTLADCASIGSIYNDDNEKDLVFIVRKLLNELAIINAANKTKRKMVQKLRKR